MMLGTSNTHFYQVMPPQPQPCEQFWNKFVLHVDPRQYERIMCRRIQRDRILQRRGKPKGVYFPLTIRQTSPRRRDGYPYEKLAFNGFSQPSPLVTKPGIPPQVHAPPPQLIPPKPMIASTIPIPVQLKQPASPPNMTTARTPLFNTQPVVSQAPAPLQKFQREIKHLQRGKQEQVKETTQYENGSFNDNSGYANFADVATLISHGKDAGLTTVASVMSGSTTYSGAPEYVSRLNSSSESLSSYTSMFNMGPDHMYADYLYPSASTSITPSALSSGIPVPYC